MATLGTMFKKIYGEALAPYGFKKIKGKQPYFVRVIGDEIVHVITCTNVYSPKQYYKRFDIYCGVATVYRQKITLELSPKDNINWLKPISSLYIYSKNGEYDKEYCKKVSEFYYKNIEQGLYDTIVKSLDFTKQVVFPIFDEIKDLKSCMDYFYMSKHDLYLYDADRNWGNEEINNHYNEGLLQFKIYNLEEYKKRCEAKYNKEFEQFAKEIQLGRCGTTQEDFERQKSDAIESMQKQIAIFEKVSCEEEQRLKVMEELMYRRQVNQEVLCSYGLEI